LADVSRKSYYEFLKRPDLPEEDAEILKIIADIQKERKGSVGYRPMAKEVSKRLNRAVNAKRVLRLMRENGLLSAVRRKKYSDEVYLRRREMKNNAPPDLINRKFFALAPRIKLVQDITYLPGKERTLYLNTIEDLYNGEILAWEISTSPDADLCKTTLKQLVETWGECFRKTIVHNDLGSSYMSYEYMNEVESHGMRASAGKKACCYDNAAMESLNAIIKTEALYCRFGKTKVEDKRVPIDDIKQTVTEFIDYYNNERPKESLGWISPVEFRRRCPKGTYLMVI